MQNDSNREWVILRTEPNPFFMGRARLMKVLNFTEKEPYQQKRVYFVRHVSLSPEYVFL